MPARPGALPWRVATVAEVREETATARTLALDVPGWPGHVAGQHLTARLTAADGYAAQRSYSIASAPAPGRLELTVQRLADGEVSPYLTETARPGDQFEVRGPIGGWFAWQPGEPRPLLLLAGGSGVVPLMSIVRAHAAAQSQASLQLVYSARTPADALFAGELAERARASPLTVTTFLFSRLTRYRGTSARADSTVTVPLDAPVSGSQGEPGRVRPPIRGYAGRLSAEVLARAALPPELTPAVFACGPSGFVEAASGLLVEAGYAAETIKTERFGPTS